MSRTVWLIPLGAIAGSAAVLIHSALQAPEEAVPATAIGTIELQQNDAPAGSAIPARGAFAAGLQAHEAAASSNNLVKVQQMIENLARQPGSVERDSQLQGLLAQFATIDPWEAARVAERLQLGADALATVYRIWADSDSEEALLALGGLWPPATQREVALAMLDVFGANRAGVETIAAAFPKAEATSFRIDAIGEVSLTDPAEAMAMADSITVSATQTIAQRRIAKIMANTDPLHALEYATTITVPIMRQRFMDELLDSWAELDPNGMFAYMETADLGQMTVSPNSFRALATIDPEKLLNLAERFAPAQRENAQIAAMQAMASMDPIHAYDRVSSLPASASRDRFINNIAQIFAADNPDSALAWVSALDPPSQSAFQGVLSTIAANQPARVAEAIVADILNPASANRAMAPNIVSFLNAALQARSPEIAQVADHLASYDDPRIRMQLNQVLQRWPQADPEAATAWIMRNPSRLSTDNAMQFSQLLANQDPALARQMLPRLSDDLRPSWIQGTARGMARTDLEGTLNWIETFRDDPAHDQALSSALLGAAAVQPQAVARLLDQAPERFSQIAPMLVSQVAPMLVASLSNQDPAMAAEWLGNRPGGSLGGMDSNLSRNLSANWSMRDPEAAESWARNLPPGDLRDGAFAGIIQTRANQGGFDAELLEQLDSPEARSLAVISALSLIRAQDEGAARKLVDEYIENPAMRAQAQQMLDRSGSTPGRNGFDPGTWTYAND